MYFHFKCKDIFRLTKIGFNATDKTAVLEMRRYDQKLIIFKKEIKHIEANKVFIKF